MLDPIELDHFLGRKPFQPVRVYVKDGRTYEIASRQHAVVGQTDLDIGIQARGEADGVCAYVVHPPLEEVLHVEPFDPTTAPYPR